jgi:hypothetical protein
MFNTLKTVSVSNVDPTKTEMGPRWSFVKFYCFLKILSRIFEILVFFKASAHLYVYFKVQRLDCSSLFIELQRSIYIFLILFKSKVTLNLKLKVLLEIRIDPRNFLKTLLSFQELFFFDIELGLSEVSPAISRVLSNEAIAFFMLPTMIVSCWILLIWRKHKYNIKIYLYYVKKLE